MRRLGTSQKPWWEAPAESLASAGQFLPRAPMILGGVPGPEQTFGAGAAVVEGQSGSVLTSRSLNVGPFLIPMSHPRVGLGAEYTAGVHSM